jgi:hypothetical protein
MVINKTVYDIIRPFIGDIPALLITDYSLPRLDATIQYDIIMCTRTLKLNNYPRYTTRESKYYIHDPYHKYMDSPLLNLRINTIQTFYYNKLINKW